MIKQEKGMERTNKEKYDTPETGVLSIMSEWIICSSGQRDDYQHEDW